MRAGLYARVSTEEQTLEQQVTKDLLFSYTQDVSSSNPQIVRVQWDVNPTWTAVALTMKEGRPLLSDQRVTSTL